MVVALCHGDVGCCSAVGHYLTSEWRTLRVLMVWCQVFLLQICPTPCVFSKYHI